LPRKEGRFTMTEGRRRQSHDRLHRRLGPYPVRPAR
jgi:hypothetical protein